MGPRRTPGWRSLLTRILPSPTRRFKGHLSRTKRRKGSGSTGTQGRTRHPQEGALTRTRPPEGRLYGCPLDRDKGDNPLPGSRRSNGGRNG